MLLNKKNIGLFGSLALLITVISVMPDKGEAKVITNVPSDISSEELRAVVVEDFEQSGNWQISSTPKQFKSDNEKAQVKNPVPILELKFLAGAPSDMIPEKWSSNGKGLEKKQCLGIHYQFKYPGDNSVHVIPAEPIRLPGKARGLSLWVHGRGNSYNLECWVKDYNGNVHILKFGSINYVGWRPLTVEIPAYIPQVIESYPQTKILTLERFVLRSEAMTTLEEVYVFFDQLKVLTDVYEVNFDGQELDKAFKDGKTNSTTNNQ